MAALALATVMHDPQRRLFSAMQSFFSPLLAGGHHLIVVVSHATPADLAEELASLGMVVAREEGSGVGAARRQSLRLALSTDASHLFYSDFDRLLHWQANFADELEATLAQVPHHDFLVLGRTLRALHTHPACMVETEVPANHVFALATGRAWDLCGAARGISRGAADRILASSTVQGTGTEAEWTVLALCPPALRVGYLEVEGLEYETADCYPEEVSAAGGVGAWAEKLSSDPAQWVLRLGYAHAVGQAALATAQRVSYCPPGL